MPNYILHPGVICGHCRSQQIGSASVNDTPLCHPDWRDFPDCYRLVTVYGHALDGSCCDDVRRYETDAVRDHDDEPELSQWADEHGYVFTPGSWPSPIGGI